MVSALTKPTMTMRGINRISLPTPGRPARSAGRRQDDGGDEVLHAVLTRHRRNDRGEAQARLA